MRTQAAARHAEQSGASDERAPEARIDDAQAELRERIADTLMQVANDEDYYRTMGPRDAALFAADRILDLLAAERPEPAAISNY